MRQQNTALNTTEQQTALHDESLNPSSSTAMARPIAMGEGHVTIAGKKEPFSFELGPIVDGVSNLTTNAVSEAGRFLSSVGVAVSVLVRKPGIAVAIAGIGIGAAAESSKGALETNGATDAPYQTLGQQQMSSGARWIKATLPNGGVIFYSGEEIEPGWILAPGHGVDTTQGVATVNEVGTGSNYLTSPGIVSSVDKVVVYPGYSAGSGFEFPDAALIHITSSTSTESVSFSSWPSLNADLTAAGYGAFGTPDTGAAPQDGNIRGFNAPVISGTTTNVSPTYYVEVNFSPDAGVPMNGKGLNGDSGGPAFNNEGQFVGILDASWGGTSQIGGTDILVASQPQVEAWIDQTINTPEPSSLAVLWIGSALLMKRARHA